jgi:1-deoxy-D-xylulose-5-phosphate synthase
MMVMTPADENECRQLLSTAFAQDCPTAVRYPRGAGAGVAVQPSLEPLPVGKAEVRRTSTAPAGQRVAILAFGSMVAPAMAAAERLDASVVNMRFVKPLDVACVLEMARTHDYVVTVEEGCVMGGAGSACLEALAAAGVATPVLQLGLPDRFVDHGDHAALLAQCGLSADGILASIRERFAVQPRAAAPRVA